MLYCDLAVWIKLKLCLRCSGLVIMQKWNQMTEEYCIQRQEIWGGDSVTVADVLFQPWYVLTIYVTMCVAQFCTDPKMSTINFISIMNIVDKLTCICSTLNVLTWLFDRIVTISSWLTNIILYYYYTCTIFCGTIVMAVYPRYSV